MLTMKRRDMLAGSAAASGLLSIGVAKNADGAAFDETSLTVFTDDFPQARDLARKTMQSTLVPLKGDLIYLFNARIARYRGAIQGYTSWSDYVLLRGLAEERGLRLRAEAQLSGAGRTLFRWVMA